MAYLIDRSGRRDLVDRVAFTRNNAYIAELADDPDLRVWLDSVGLSVAEAARIQPEYEPFQPRGVSDDYAVASVLISGTALATLGLNFIAPSRATGWAGIIAGSLGVIAGAANVDRNDGTQNVAAANLIIGGGAMAVGLYRLLTPRPARRVDGQSLQSDGIEPRLAFVPQAIQTSRGTRIGLGLHANF
jgi:hypothetical protein